MNLGTRIQHRRRELKISIEELAKKTELAQGTLRAYEQGRRIPSVTAFKKVAAVLELDGHWCDEITWQWNSDQEKIELALGPGFHGRLRPSKMATESLRLSLIQKILTADAKTLSAVNMLI